MKIKETRVKMSDGSEKEYEAKGVDIFTKGMNSLAWDLPGNSGEA